MRFGQLIWSCDTANNQVSCSCGIWEEHSNYYSIRLESDVIILEAQLSDKKLPRPKWGSW